MMILELTNTEASILTLSLLQCRKNVRKGFKRNYGKQEGKEKLSSYDELSEIMKEAAIDALKSDPSHIKKISMYEAEMNMLHSFLDWYVPEVQRTVQEAAKQKETNIPIEDQKHIDLLVDIKRKTDTLMACCHA